jgi:indolepyruvate decarboxylase
MPLVSEFLCERLGNAGVKHIFGVQGPYINNFLDVISQSDRIKFISNTDESHAGFAANAYARFNGIGCVCATYNVGALKLCNSVAGAYAERSPVVIIGGSPGMKDRNKDFLSNHLVESFSSQKEMFDHITAHSVVLDNATTAGWKIDNALNILKETKQPVYIEIPRDVASQPIKYDVYTQGTPNNDKSDGASLKEAIEDVSSYLKSSKNPVIIMGVQITRFNLEDLLIKFAEKHNIPIVTTFLSKSSICETHPLFSGVYFGEQTRNLEVKNRVESSDCLLIFGEMLTDTGFGFVTPKFDNSNTIFCSIENLRVKNHIYCGIRFIDFCKDFFRIDLGKKEFVSSTKSNRTKFAPTEGQRISLKRFFEKLNSILDENFAVLADIGEYMLDAAELVVPHHRFISSAFYCSTGLALPGAMSVQLLNAGIRPLVVVSEDSFQTSSMEISTLVQNNLNPIIFVINQKKNSIKSWNYEKICDIIGGVGYLVNDETELDNAINACLKKKSLSVINVVLDVSSQV